MPPNANASPHTSVRRWLRPLWATLVVLAMAAAGFLAGPRYVAGPNSPTSRASPPQDLRSLDSWLASQESRRDIKPGTAKGVVWAGAVGEETEWAVVYLHGFSASRLETAPLTQEVAKALGANVFYARLSGHGLPGSAMGQVTLQDWLADAREALEIGQKLGRKVLLISCSTGSTLATWLGTEGLEAQVAGHVFISPNFGPKDSRANLLIGPWGIQIAEGILGADTGWTASSEAEANAWTTRYPTKSLLPMMALVKAARESPLERFKTPVLVLYSPQDRVVNPQETLAAVTRFGSPEKLVLPVTFSDAKDQHVLAGDIKAPAATAPMATIIVNWALKLPK
jgi:alpha-beta hydrolase superfamily lysophospholipase